MSIEVIVWVCLFGIPVAAFFLLYRKKLWLRVVVALSAFLFLVILIPNLMPARTTSAASACLNELRIIQVAKSRWATIFHKGPSDVPTMLDLFSGTNAIELSEGTDLPPGVFARMPQCPAGGTLIPGAVSEDPKCSTGYPTHTLSNYR